MLATEMGMSEERNKTTRTSLPYLPPGVTNVRAEMWAAVRAVQLAPLDCDLVIWGDCDQVGNVVAPEGQPRHLG